MPDGIVYSYWTPCITTGLFRRGHVFHDGDRPFDFYEASLKAESWNLKAPKVDLCECRWGLSNFDAQFLVYDKEDLAVIVEALLAAPKLEDSTQSF
jgi:hypothetical protein